MAGIPGATANNTLPPTAALLALGVVQYLVLRVVEPAAQRWMRRRSPWRTVVGVRASIVTLYLWHVPAMALVVLAGHVAGLGLSPVALEAS